MSVTIPDATVAYLLDVTIGCEDDGYRLAAEPECLGMDDGEIRYRAVFQRTEDGTYWAGRLSVALIDTGYDPDTDLSDWVPEDVECTPVVPVPAVRYVPAGGAA